MARIRTIKPEFWKHEVLSDLPEATHILAAALLNEADDEGYFNANPRLISAACFPLRNPSTTVVDSLNQLEAAGYIQRASGEDGKVYGLIVNFRKHQVVNRPRASKIRQLVPVLERSEQHHASVTEASVTEREEELETEQGSESRARAGDASPPSQSPAAALAAALRKAGCPDADEFHPSIKAAIIDRLPGDALTALLGTEKGAGKPAAYVVATVRGRIADAETGGVRAAGVAQPGPGPAPSAPVREPESQDVANAKARELWAELGRSSEEIDVPLASPKPSHRQGAAR